MALLSLATLVPRASLATSAPKVGDVTSALKNARQKVDAANDASRVPAVKQNVVRGTLERRDLAIAQYEAAEQAGKHPSPLSKPEYAVVWSGKENAGDMNGNYAMRFIGQGSVNPQALREVGGQRFVPGLDAMIVLDVRKLNVDGTQNSDYGKVVNMVQVPAPTGFEGEPHHMQYEWLPGQPIVAGHLFTDTTTIWDVSDIPNITLKNIIRPEDTPQGSLPDAYDFLPDGRAIGTYMGGPNLPPNMGGSPGSIVVFKPDSAKTLVLESETPSGAFGAITRGNPNGVPEPCSAIEARPAGTCANPHGIQVRADLGRMVTNDYADARELATDPVKPVDEHALRPTSRIWDISNPAAPKLISVAHMPKGPKDPANPAHGNLGIMEGAKTYAPSKAFFAESMCGGGIFFLPDVTNVQPDSSSQWRQVFDDAMAEDAVENRDVNGAGGGQGSEPGACGGGAWQQVSQDNRFMFHAVGGRNPGSDSEADTGVPKMIYVLNIEQLIKSAQDGHVDCNIDTIKELGQRHGDEADCPTLVSVLTVDDYTTGGPHWAALDNHSYTPAGGPTRLLFSDYFVARTGYDGNHRVYMVDIDPQTGALTYDRQWRDEKTGALGIDFNRRDWPNNPGAGFYKPHSMVWVTAPGVS